MAMTREGEPYGGRWTILLLVVTFAAYFGSLTNGFVGWDDPQLVTQNVAVRTFDLPAIATDFAQSNWHPLTMLSYALEHAIVELDPFLYHLTNVLLHLANCVLVLALVRRLLPASRVAPLAVAFLFALHPLHVESVAWISERKDVLSTFFFVAAALAYLRFVETKGARAFWIPFGLFVAALLSKSMAVTLPVVLVLLDVYRERRFAWRMAIAKWPYFAASIALGVVNLAGQSTTAIVASEPTRIPHALGNAWRSLVFYVDKSIWPSDLSIYYDESVLNVGVAAHVVFFVVIGGLALYAWKVPARRAPILFGLAVFLVTLALVLKLIPFGEQSLVNDRYLYIPSIGLFLAFAVVIEDVWNKVRTRGTGGRLFAYAAGAAVVLGSAQATFLRTRVWRDDETLWSNVIENYPTTPKAHEYLAFHYHDTGEMDLALTHMEEAARLSPQSSTLLMNLGALYGNLQRTKEARAAFERVVAADPNNAAAHANLGISLYSSGERGTAEEHLRTALALDPDFPAALLILGRLCGQTGRVGEAENLLEAAVRVSPWQQEPYCDLIDLMLRTNRKPAAEAWLNRAAQARIPIPAKLVAAVRGG